MAKKINSNDRRKLLEARGRGLSNSEIKRQLGIIDDRTLRRHLQLAEQEQEARAVKTEILKEALRDHLAELRQLIENWKATIRIQPVTVLPSVMAYSMESLHSNRLFDCLKSHLPFPILWRDYNQWEAKYSSYIDNCDKLREEIQKEATTETRLDFMDDNVTLPHLSSRFIDWILRQVEYKLQKVSEGRFEFHWKHYKVEIDKQPAEVRQMSVHPGGQLLEIINQHEVNSEFYEKKCRELLHSCLKGGTVANLLTLFDDLRYLETKIHNSLEEILLRRDYILYACNLCPGKPRLLR
jgi:hypothetical protein